jgi:putative transposase
MRKPRLLKEGAKYHVMARAQRHEMILESNVLKAMFLEVVRRAKKKYRLQLYNFCIMGTHIHFIIKPAEKESLSRIMQWILSVFAIKYNKMHDYIGHVWYDRFRSVLIDDIMQFLRVFVYVMENPVKAELVKDPLDYRYSGVSFYAEGVMDLFEPP